MVIGCSNIYQGLPGVKRGEVKQLRVIEETSRVSPTTMTGSPYNQVFLVSAALALILVSLPRLLAPHAHSAAKGSPYECGELPQGSSWVRFDVRFYLVAILFILFSKPFCMWSSDSWSWISHQCSEILEEHFHYKRHRSILWHGYYSSVPRHSF